MASESELLGHIYDRTRSLASHILLGPGDDCALVAGPKGDRTLLTVDQLVEHRHFKPGTPIDLIARKAVGRSVSDIAATGGSPAWGLATGLLPTGYQHGDELFDAMAQWANHWSCPLVGGDIAFHDGPIVLTVTVGGLPGEQLLTRDAARVGDAIYLTGRVGGSLASGRHLEVSPRVEVGRVLSTMDTVHACIDVSDGVGRDAGRIASASGVRFELESDQLPLHESCTWQDGLGDGEDYELLFTAVGPVPETIASVPITRIGRVTKASGCVVRTPGGDWIDASAEGWDHA